MELNWARPIARGEEAVGFSHFAFVVVIARRSLGPEAFP